MVSHLREAVPEGDTQGSGIQSNLVLPRIAITAKIQKKDVVFLLAIKLWESKKNKFRKKAKYWIELAQLQMMNNFTRGNFKKKKKERPLACLNLVRSHFLSSLWGVLKQLQFCGVRMDTCFH